MVYRHIKRLPVKDVHVIYLVLDLSCMPECNSVPEELLLKTQEMPTKTDDKSLLYH